MQDTGFGFLWVSLVPSFKFPFLTALAKQGETTQCQHSRHGSQRSPQQRCRRHQHSHLETDPNTPNEVQRKEEEKTGGTIHSSVMWLHAERGGAGGGGERRWVESYERQSGTYMFVVHCLKPTQPGRQSWGGAYMAGNPSSIRRSPSLQPTPFITKVVVRQPLRQSCMNSPSHTGCAVQQILIYTLTERFLK